MNNLVSLRDKIEKLEKKQHVEIVRIIQNNSIDFTENRNGIFLNMKNLTTKCVNEIEKYLKYIDIQKKQIEYDENTKAQYANTFFKCNKE